MNSGSWRRPALIAVLGLASAFGAFALYRGQSTSVDRGIHGVVPEIPPGYRVENLGVAEPKAAWTTLHALLKETRQAAVVFRRGAIETTLLADMDAALLDERILATSGTLRRVLWPGDPAKRLEAAVETGSLRVEGMPEADKRNLYH